MPHRADAMIEEVAQICGHRLSDQQVYRLVDTLLAEFELALFKRVAPRKCLDDGLALINRTYPRLFRRSEALDLVGVVTDYICTDIEERLH